MSYLGPEHVLERFSEFALSEIRPAIDNGFLDTRVQTQFVIGRER